MNYRYKKWQIFRKKLPVIDFIKNKVYNRTLSFSEFIKYKLIDKIPIECVNEADRKIVEKFGIEKCKELDWELIDKRIYTDHDVNIRELLMTIDSQTEDINNTLYEILKDKIKPSDYSDKMRERYPERWLDPSQADDNYKKNLMYSFNEGEIRLEKIIKNWKLFKDKDLSFCLQNDKANNKHITDTMIKEFMANYGSIAPLVLRTSNIYTFISEISSISTETEKKQYIKQFTDGILDDVKKSYEQYSYNILEDEEYREIFKYSSLEEFLKSFNNGYLPENLTKELQELPKDFIFNMPIPFTTLFDYNVISLIGKLGLKNIVDFDNECGHFFTNNNCEMLKLMNSAYFHYSANEHDPQRSLLYDKDGKYIYGGRNKEQFYETMRRILMYGPSNRDFPNFPNYSCITGEFREKNKDLFISTDTPEEFQQLFYTKTITPRILLEHPEYIQHLEGKNLSLFLKKRSIEYKEKDGPYEFYNYENLYAFLNRKTDFNGVISFITKNCDLLDAIFDVAKNQDDLNLSNDDDINQIQKKINDTYIKAFIENGIAYPKEIPQSLKDDYPNYFLPDDTPQNIKEKFYNKEFTLKSLEDNPDLLKLFDKVNIACGFPSDMAWIIPLYENTNDLKTANYNRLKIISSYSKIDDVVLRKAFKEFVTEAKSTLDLEKIEYVSELLYRLSLSNSNEIFVFRKELAKQLLSSDNPLETFNKIESIFMKQNIPTVGKIYSCFEILHPDFQGFDFDNSMISPILKKSSTNNKKIIVFSDLIKCSFGSNNKSVNEYLKNIELGSKLYERIRSGQIQFESLDENEKHELTVFSNHLATLYNNTLKAKKSNELFTPSGDTLKDILDLSKKLSPNGSLDYNLADRVIRMFCGFAGIDTLKEAKDYIEQKVKSADLRNRKEATTDMILEQGDFIKGIGNIDFLRNILQNGSVAREFLGESAGSDNTPLDTDLSIIRNSSYSTSSQIEDTEASKYGPIWFVLKNDDRFITTRTSDEDLETKRDLSKLEVFYTGVLGKGHYGIRTGFASSEINYIVVEEYDPRVGIEIALNGFYIPIANKEGKIIFTPNDYDKLREKMSGLSYFGENNYTFSKNLINEETKLLAQQIEQNNYETQLKREKINNIIRKSVEELGLNLKTQIDGDLTEGFVELIDTGSTGRGTNKPGNGDFDFMMKLDKSLLYNPTKLNELKQTILKNLGKEKNDEIINTGDFRLKKVQIDNNTKVDIDITFAEKTDKVLYSTDMALKDRLETIKRIDSEKYKYVIANILLAKKVLKQAGAYKPDRGDEPQGGLGGVGIENWILQNGGSFIDAARSFVEAAEGKSFSEFKKSYRIWDFGDNHLAAKRGFYPHDNFVSHNMSESGYTIMTETLKEYLKSIDMTQQDPERRK